MWSILYDQSSIMSIMAIATFQDDWSEILTLDVFINMYGHYVILMKGSVHMFQ